MGPGVDKLFLNLNGKPVVAHTWKKFDAAKCIDEIVLVIRQEMESAFQEMAREENLAKPFRLIPGGRERQDSVWNGLQALNKTCEIVSIQDAARPCTDPTLIEATVQTAQRMGAAVAAQAITDTIKESSDGRIIERTLDRSRLWSVQTPQTFRVDVIRGALKEVRERGLLVTDDTAACELVGQRVELVVSNAPNPKVTRPEDVPYVELVLRNLETG